MIIRENEVIALIDQISQPDFLKKTLGFKKAKLDLKNIVVAGHSFGGITALGAACADQRVKAAVSLDPWFFPHHMELNAGKFGIKGKDQATCMIVTEQFYTFLRAAYDPKY